MPLSHVDPSPLLSNHPLLPRPNSKPRANKSSKVSSNRKKKKSSVSSTKNNKGVRVDNIYQTRLNEANERVAAIVGNTYTVRSSTDEMDWMDVFETKKEEAQTLQAEIDKTDKEIDKMVYELYGLTKEEIQIVENS